jgi:CheY-like chemotaxis protein/HPt (histidine-containing phosphotransfer) domain-containing protein
MSVEDHADGPAALASIDAGARFDVVLLDMHMPLMDGVRLATELRARPSTRDLPLLLLTSLGSRPPESEQLGLRHLTKPVKAAALRTTVASALGARLQTTGPGEAAVPDRRLRVLLAEDNLVNQRVAVLMLERLGYRADVVANGREAVRALTDTPYDVVLMDVQMPELDGIAATEQVRSQLPEDRQPRIIAMTASALTEDRERCLDAGMDDFLSKPVRREELAEALQRTARSLTPASGSVRVGAAAGAEPADGAQPAAPAADGAQPGAPAVDGADTAPTARESPAVTPPASAPATADLPVLDPTVLGALASRLGERGPALLANLLSTWQDESTRRLAELRAAVEAGDAGAVGRAAHAVKGGSASMGAVRLAAVCAEVEAHVRDSPPYDLAGCERRITSEIEQAGEALAAAYGDVRS